MKKGDVILTPPWTWHDHGHEGTFIILQDTFASSSIILTIKYV